MPFRRLLTQHGTPLFFGKDARPISEVIMRRHPLAMALYGVVFLLGLVFVLHWYAHGVSEKTLFPGVSEWAIFAWKWMMVSGGGGALICLWAKPRPSPHWPDLADLLHLEGIAAIVGAFGLFTYLIVVINLMGFSDSAPAVVIYGVIVVGHFVRAYQAIWDASRLQRLATLAETAQEVRDAAAD